MKLFLILMFSFLTSLCAWAEDAAPKRVDGWHGQTDMGAAFTLNSNDKVIGQTDGTTSTLGIKISGNLNNNSGYNEVKNNLDLSEAFTNSTSVSGYNKTTDLLNEQTQYLYHLQKPEWMSLFAKLKINTALFQGTDVRPQPVTYVINRNSGATDTLTSSTLHLTNPWTPFELDESLGAEAELLKTQDAQAHFRFGLAAQQTFADGQFAISDDPTTSTIEVKELSNITQEGLETGADLTGQITSQNLKYKLKADLMLPLITSGRGVDGKSNIQLINQDYAAGLEFKISELIKLIYEVKATRKPQLLDAMQVSQNVLLTLGHSFLY